VSVVEEVLLLIVEMEEESKDAEQILAAVKDRLQSIGWRERAPAPPPDDGFSVRKGL
jgi:hypothetical protein